MHPVSWRLGELAARLGVTLRGDPEVEINGLASLEHAQANQLGFLANPKYCKQLESTAAGGVIVDAEAAERFGGNSLISPHPYSTYIECARLFDPSPRPDPGIDSSARISPEARVDPTASIGPFAVICSGARIDAGAVIGAHCHVGAGALVGARTRLYPQVVLYHGVTLGADCIVHSHAVIGGDGFGYAPLNPGWEKIPQLGGVCIGDRVEIGSMTTVDRGALDDTWIGDGVKIDNHVQVAHNVRIGPNTAIASGTGISGSTVIGRNCTIGGAVGIAGHLTIADGVHLTGMAMVTGSIREPGAYSSGTGLMESREWRKNAARFRQLDETTRRLKELERQMSQLQNHLEAGPPHD